MWEFSFSLYWEPYGSGLGNSQRILNWWDLSDHTVVAELVLLIAVALWIRAWQLTKDLELVRSERPHCGSRASPLDCSWPLNGCPLIWAYSYSILTKCWLCFVAVAKTSILIQQLYAVIQRYTSYLTAHGGPNTWNDVWHWLRPPQPWGYALLSPKWGFVDLTTTLSTLDWRVTIKS
jgi:hypothetical protein